MQRAGLVHISSMMPFATPPKACRPDTDAAPWNTHWSRLCDHDLVARLKQYPSGTRAKMQCRKCGQGVGTLIPMEGVTEKWDDEFESRVQNEYDAACKAWHRKILEFSPNSTGVRSESWWQMYGRYLRSSVWQVKRDLVMQRSGGVCEACGQADAEQVHHLKYPETFGLEPLWDLRAVCIPCHQVFHPHMRQ